ncbi:MAG TPA: hypothetical protein VD794_06985 [Flavisolibacter sp.]|nr:hypothetical protein [Flavisolibacter sp.]
MDHFVRDTVWKSLDSIRGEFPIDNLKVFELIADKTGHERFSEIIKDKNLLKQLLNDYSLIAPDYLIHFLEKLIEEFNPQSCLDPWLNLSSPIAHKALNNATAISFNSESSSLAKSIFNNHGLEVIIGHPTSQLNLISKKFDFIICLPPLEVRDTLKVAEEFLKEHDLKPSINLSTNLIYQSSLLLEDSGKGVFLVSPSFFNDIRVRENLKKLGLTVEAVFSIPKGAFLPRTAIKTDLVVISKKEIAKTFVAELSDNKDVNSTILTNYLANKENKVIQLGTLVEFENFKSFQNLISERNYLQITKRIGYDPVKMADIITKIEAIKSDVIEKIEVLPNTIFFPRIGNREVVTSLSSMVVKPKNYYQIQFNSELADACYVANYFNSQICRELLQSITTIKTVVSEIPITNILNSSIHLPDISTQIHIVEINNQIEQFNVHLEELKRTLWKQPRKFNEIEKSLKRINHKENLEHWIDKLPFPISSILWRFYATQENSKKIEHLFHFFEGFSQFLSMIMLSAFVQDKEFYKSERHKWIGTDVKFKDWYLKATFGNWNSLAANLSKATRAYLNNSETRDICKSLYGNPSQSFLDSITNKEIITTLFEASSLRNQWKGHGGISSEEENSQRVAKLEQLLSELRRLIADGFDEVDLVKPKSGELENGLWTFNGKLLKGAKSPFKDVKTKSLIGLEKNKIYIAHKDQLKPVELLPFIKYYDVEEACYFYSSIESTNVRWVSYHFERNPELVQPIDQELINAFEFLKL